MSPARTAISSERSIPARSIFATYSSICDAAPHLVRHAHLVHEVLVDADLPVLDLERCVRIAHDVDRAVVHDSSSSAGCYAACAGRGRGLPGDGYGALFELDQPYDFRP